MTYTQDGVEIEHPARNAIRTVLGLSGLVSLVVGILIIGWPTKVVAVLAGIIAVYAAIAGIVNLAIGIFSRVRGGWSRVGYLALGALFIVAAVVAFANLTAAGAALGALISIMVGIVWVIEGIVAVSLVSKSPSKVWTAVYAVLSVVAGMMLITSPLWGAAMLWLLLGVSLVVLGVVQIVRAVSFR